MAEFKYQVDPDFDYVVDEKGNTFIALRKIKWGDAENAKLDLRKYYAREDGDTMSKGVSFLTEDGPHELARVLIEQGYGHPQDIANAILDNRPDIGSVIYSAVEDHPGYIEEWNNYLAEHEDELIREPEELYSPEEMIA